MEIARIDVRIYGCAIIQRVRFADGTSRYQCGLDVAPEYRDMYWKGRAEDNWLLFPPRRAHWSSREEL